MDIENSAIYNEVQKVITDRAKPVHFNYAAVLHPNAIGGEYHAMKVLSIDLIRDYESEYADGVLIELVIAKGVYAKYIYPNQGNLDITLRKTPLIEAGSNTDIQNRVQTERFTAILDDTGDPAMEGGAFASVSTTTLDLSPPVTVRFQLINKAMEKLRSVQLGGIFRNVKVGDLLKLMLTEGSSSIQLESSQQVRGVNMIAANNQQVRDHVIVPQGTKLVELPHFMQNDGGGVYSAGMGYYFQDNYWYVYPCFDTTRFNSVPETVTIVVIPPNKLPHIERTYRQTGDNLIILATGEVRFRDNTEVNQMNQGNGIRFANSDRFMDDFSTTVNNKTVANRGNTASEFMMEERGNGANFAPMSANAITANPYREYSRLAKRTGGVVGISWQNSNPALVRPGVPVKILYLSDGEVKEKKGVFLKAHHYTSMAGQGLTDSRYLTNSVLSVFVKE